MVSDACGIMIFFPPFCFFEKKLFGIFKNEDGKVSMSEAFLCMVVEPDLVHGNICAAALLVLYLALQLYLRTAISCAM